MAQSSWFPDPRPRLADVSAAIEVLQKAETDAASHAKGTATVRNEKRAIVHKMLNQLCAQVDATANAHPQHGGEIIETAGMYVKRVGAKPSRVFRAKRGPNTGDITLVAPRAAKSASYEWAFRIMGQTAWTIGAVTLRSTATLRGFQPGTMVELRYRVTTKDGTGDWSDIVPFIVE